MGGDNSRIDIRGTGKEAFSLALRAAFALFAAGGMAKFYRLHRSDSDSSIKDEKVLTLSFYWGKPDSGEGHDFVPFTVEKDGEACVHEAWAWLDSKEPKDYADECDLDGSLSKGWRLSHVREGIWKASFYEIISVQPHWAWMSK